jgi:hypothetical protein
LYDSGHGYQGVFYVLALWCAVGAIVLAALKIPVKKATETAESRGF